jgi:hypothetical protein
MTFEHLEKILKKLKEMRDAGITIPANLLEAIDSLAGQLEPFLKDSHEKREFDKIERRDSIIDIYLSLWKILYDDLYQQILLEHEQFREIVGDMLFDKYDSLIVREEDIRVRLTQIHDILVEQWKSPIPPAIEQICLQESLLTHEMLYSYITDRQHCGENPEYGYKEGSSLARDARPLSFEEYVDYQTEKVNDVCDWYCKCDEFTMNKKSYNFLCNPQSDTALGEEAMKMYGSMKYEDIFRLLNKEHCISNHFNIDDC